MFEADYKLGNHSEESAVRNKTLFGMYYWVDVEQYGGRFVNITLLQEYGSVSNIGITSPGDRHINLEYFFLTYGAEIEELYNAVGYAYQQQCLNGKIHRERVVINTMMYSVDIRRGNKIKYKI